MTYHALHVPREELDDVLCLLVPKEDVPTVAAAHHILTSQTKEVHSFHCGMES